LQAILNHDERLWCKGKCLHQGRSLYAGGFYAYCFFPFLLRDFFKMHVCERQKYGKFLQKSYCKGIEFLQKQLYNNSSQTKVNRFTKARILEAHLFRSPDDIMMTHPNKAPQNRMEA
jgi:hypothetical protein